MTTAVFKRSNVLGRIADPGVWADWAALVGLVALVITFQIADPTFLSAGNLRALLASSAILVILTVGQAFVICTAGIDLSIASVMTFSAVMLGQTFEWGVALSCVVAVVVGGLMGMINGMLVAKARITDFIVALGMLSAASGAALIVADGKPKTIISPFLLNLSTGGLGVVGWPVIVAAVVAVIGHIVLFRTRYGTYVLATGGSKEAAVAAGIRTDRIKIAVYMTSGALAGLAAILLVARVGAAEPAANLQFLLNSVASVVLGGVSLFGGRGTIIGPVIGALLLTVLVNGLTLLGVSEYYQPLSVGIVVVLAAYLMRYQK